MTDWRPNWTALRRDHALLEENSARKQKESKSALVLGRKARWEQELWWAARVYLKHENVSSRAVRFDILRHLSRKCFIHCGFPPQLIISIIKPQLHFQNKTSRTLTDRVGRGERVVGGNLTSAECFVEIQSSVSLASSNPSRAHATWKRVRHRRWRRHTSELVPLLYYRAGQKSGP